MGRPWVPWSQLTGNWLRTKWVIGFSRITQSVSSAGIKTPRARASEATLIATAPVLGLRCTTRACACVVDSVLSPVGVDGTASPLLLHSRVAHVSIDRGQLDVPSDDERRFVSLRTDGTRTAEAVATHPHVSPQTALTLRVPPPGRSRTPHRVARDRRHSPEPHRSHPRVCAVGCTPRSDRPSGLVTSAVPSDAETGDCHAATRRRDRCAARRCRTGARRAAPPPEDRVHRRHCRSVPRCSLGRRSACRREIAEVVPRATSSCFAQSHGLPLQR